LVVNKSRVMRTRPIFQDWALEFTVHYMPDVLNKEDITGFMNVAGKYIGLSDWRPKYGRFIIESCESVDPDF